MSSVIVDLSFQPSHPKALSVSGQTSYTGDLTVLGPVDAADRSAVLGEAHALLHLIDFDEPFGYSVVEALACGTPVVAYPRGSMRELLDPRHGGFAVTSVADAVHAVECATTVDRTAVRTAAIARFDKETMIDHYCAVYDEILNASR